MYTLSSDSWRRVEISSTNNIILYPNNLEPAPLVSGALHWMALIREGKWLRQRRSIMPFDANTETFRELALPNYTGNSYCIALFKGKLTFTTLDKHQCSIWVMKKYGAVESWNKLFVVPFQRAHYCLAFTEYGSLLVSYCYTIIPMRNEEFKFVLIDAETLHEKKDPDIQHPSYVATFMESLVLLDGANLVSYKTDGGVHMRMRSLVVWMK